VTRDVKKLAEFGLVRVRQQNNPGHGIVQMAHKLACGRISDEVFTGVAGPLASLVRKPLSFPRRKPRTCRQ
jgi:hypothetical protein